MTLANRITLTRLALTPVFLLLLVMYTRDQQWIRYTAIVAFLLAAVSDCVDGFIARAYNQKTKLGAVLDPLADKLLMNLTFVFLAVNEHFETQVPYWVPAIILSRDVLIVTGAYILNEYFGPLRVRPRILGKLTTLFEACAVLAILCEWDFAYPLLMITVFLATVSWVDYMYSGYRQVGDEEES